MDGVTYNSQNQVVMRVYYLTATALKRGQVVCYQETVGNLVQGMGVDVEIPNSDNVICPAGIVDDDAVGLTGPCWITIVRPKPGDVVNLLVDGTTDIVAKSSYLTISAGSLFCYVTDAAPAIADVLVFLALEGFTTDATYTTIKAICTMG